MFPKLWQLLLRTYFRTFFLTLATFIALLLVSRFKELARFAALSCSWFKTALFTFYQLPWILPIAIPLSALLASFLLFQQMSRSHELTALRSSGIGFKTLFTPILLAALALSIGNGFVVSEIAPYCRQKTRQILYHETTSNPLLLLQRQTLVKINETYLRLFVEDEGKTAKDFLLISPTASGDKLSLLACKELWLEDDELHGKNFSIASFYPSLVIENQRFMRTEAPFLSASLKKNRPRLDPGSLNLRMLKIRIDEKNQFSKGAIIELFRRLSLILAPFTFSLLGASFGTEQGRQKRIRHVAKAVCLILLALIAYFLGKELKNAPALAMCVFFYPHILLCYYSLKRLSLLSKGKTC
jgi:lipopolysaccharide export system permease protein